MATSVATKKVWLLEVDELRGQGHEEGLECEAGEEVEQHSECDGEGECGQSSLEEGEAQQGQAQAGDDAQVGRKHCGHGWTKRTDNIVLFIMEQ